MRILLVEDDKWLCNALLYHLKKENYAVDIALDGETGLELALSAEYDLVLLDRMLPKLDGLEVLKRIRRAGLKYPVLFITAMDAVEERVNGLDAGADDYLVKPFDTQELLARVRALCPVVVAVVGTVVGSCSRACARYAGGRPSRWRRTPCGWTTWSCCRGPERCAAGSAAWS